MREARNECEARGEEFNEGLLGVGLTKHGETDHTKRGKIVISADIVLGLRHAVQKDFLKDHETVTQTKPITCEVGSCPGRGFDYFQKLNFLMYKYGNDTT